jgi:hypothetical protein
MFTKKLIAAAVLGLGIAGTAQAGTVDFTFQGCGNASCAVQAATLDWAPGNVLALGGAGGGAPLPIGTAVTDLYQANLAIVQDGNGAPIFTNVNFGSFFSVVAGFGEVVNANSSGNQTQFSFNPADPTNFFNVYVDGAAGNNLSGLGFAGGTVALSGVIVGVESSVTATNFNPAGNPLDGFGGNDYPGVTTIATNGSAKVTVRVTSVNTNYFPDLPVTTSIVFSLTNSSLITPFNQVNPSAQFSIDGIADGGTASNIGTANGITGPNFQFQADGNSSFLIPEPGSLALIGASLLGLFGIRRRKETA